MLASGVVNRICCVSMRTQHTGSKAEFLSGRDGVQGEQERSKARRSRADIPGEQAPNLKLISCSSRSAPCMHHDQSLTPCRAQVGLNLARPQRRRESEIMRRGGAAFRR